MVLEMRDTGIFLSSNNSNICSLRMANCSYKFTAEKNMSVDNQTVDFTIRNVPSDHIWLRMRHN